LLQQFKTLLTLAAVTGASAFAPNAAFGVRTTALGAAADYGKYDGEMFDNEAKKDVYASWDPNAPRTGNNFNPFETWDGNSPDASGIYPGESRYKDPARGDISFAIMMVQRAEADERAANPKAGDAPGCPGCKN
jgi:hypothetical protein